MNKKQFPVDLAVEAIEKSLNNPECTREIIKLEKLFSNIEDLEAELKQAKINFNAAATPLSNMFDMLGLCFYNLPSKNFQIRERNYKEIRVVDTGAFMRWLKDNCRPDEVLELLTPPTTIGDMKKFISKKLQNTKILDFEIDGVITKNNYTLLRGYRNGEESKSFKKEGNKKEGLSRQRSGDYKKSKSINSKPKRASGVK